MRDTTSEQARMDISKHFEHYFEIEGMHSLLSRLSISQAVFGRPRHRQVSADKPGRAGDEDIH